MPDPAWYKDAIVYEVHVRGFCDSNADGIGDFAGLTGKLPYLHDLGVTCLWLLSFYPSPLRDDGYDIADYTAINPIYGTLDDFRRFVDAAHALQLRVLTELVINHTSDAHPWFQRARRAPKGSPERAFYVWSDTDTTYAGTRIIFTDTERSNWAYDPVAGQYDWHRFFSHQPDLNLDNPAVLDAMLDVMRFWLDLGVDALRLDAIPYLIEREGTINENLPDTHTRLKRFRREVDARDPGRALLAEANQWPSDVQAYFGDGDECHMAFHFPLMPRMFMALRQEERHPIVEIMNQTPEIPPGCQWAIFLRNHDELTLETVSDEERDYMYAQDAKDPQMRVNLGIRRRLAPLMENGRSRIEQMNSLLLSMPGTPIVYYGDEIGMGDNVYLGDRNGVRTPMPWSSDRNAGFSRADPARLYAPVITDPVYGYEAINVEAQERTPFSLLHWMKRMIALCRQHPVFGRGSAVHFEREPEGSRVRARLGAGHDPLRRHMSRTVQPAEIPLAEFAGLTPVEMLGQTEFPRIGDQPYFLTLAPYGVYWFQLTHVVTPITARTAPVVEEPAAAPSLFAGLVWESTLDGGLRTIVERRALVPFLERQRWFGGTARPVAAARFADWTMLRGGTDPAFLTIVEVDYRDGGTERYALPLAMAERGRRGREGPSRGRARADVGRTQGRAPRRHLRRPGVRAPVGRRLRPPEEIAEAVGTYLTVAEVLGRRTGELHVRLSGERADPAFAPAPLGRADLKRLRAGVRRHAADQLALVERTLPRFDDRCRGLAARVLQRRKDLLRQVETAADVRDAGCAIRVHGTFHLGQVLVTEGDVVIFDFEGEPARPLAERRAKASPLRDVAGMLRSFSYAALTALDAATLTRPEDVERLAPWADAWETWVAAGFLQAYRAAVRDTPILPPRAEDLEALLALFVLDKALYEFGDELNNRPDRVHVPLSGLLRLPLPHVPARASPRPCADVQSCD